MGKRLILFISFLCVLAFVLGLSTYKSEFKKDEILDQNYLAKKIESIKAERKAEAERIANLGKPQIIEKKKVMIDPENPVIKAAIAAYNGEAQCLSCHGEKGQGSEEKKAPLIAGQHEWYLIDHLTQLKNGKRAIEGEAKAFHAKISDEDIKALSKYISLLRVE